MVDYPDCDDYFLLLGMPKSGSVEVDNQKWFFKKHGQGFEFRNVNDQRLVDITERIDQPNLFDEWRLHLYFESIDRSSCDLKSELKSAIELGQIIPSPEFPNLLSLNHQIGAENEKIN